MKIILENKEITWNKDTPLKSLTKNNKKIVGAVYNRKIRDLNYCPKKDGNLSWIYKDSETGLLLEERTLSFILIAATKLLYPDAIIRIEHTLSSCLYCCFENLEITNEVVHHIYEKMYQMVENKEPIHRKVVEKQEAVSYFEELGLYDKADLLRYRKSEMSSIYELCGVHDYFYGVMYVDLSYVDTFYIHPYHKGLLLGTKSTYQDQPKLFQVFNEYEMWGRKIGISNVAQLNKCIIDNHYTDVVLMCEAMMEKKLGDIVENIIHMEDKKKLILIAGPSSAGKTTFSKRLGIQFKLAGIRPIILSMDDFYLNRIDTPKLPDGSYDFESIHSVDLKLFNETVNDLLNGKDVMLPYFDFMTGIRHFSKTLTHLEENNILIVEGIHALNPISSEMVDDKAKYKIYINALTHLNLDLHNRISTSDYRKIRRIVRDYQFRGFSAAKTIESWSKVEYGEQTNIYPYQEEADCIFNTSMVYEMSILKKFAIKLLDQIHINEPEYLEANRLRYMLNYFLDGDETNVPRNSILAEFIGNSVFFENNKG